MATVTPYNQIQVMRDEARVDTTQNEIISHGKHKAIFTMQTKSCATDDLVIILTRLVSLPKQKRGVIDSKGRLYLVFIICLLSIEGQKAYRKMESVIAAEVCPVPARSRELDATFYSDKACADS